MKKIIFLVAIALASFASADTKINGAATHWVLKNISQISSGGFFPKIQYMCRYQEVRTHDNVSLPNFQTITVNNAARDCPGTKR